MNRNGTALPATGEADAGMATAALGLPGFVVLAAGEYGGELELLVETTESVTGCPRCEVVAALHDRQARLVRDLPAGGRPVVLVWFKRVWRCREALCEQRTWSERSPVIRPRAVLTERARAECARRVGQDGHRRRPARRRPRRGVGHGDARGRRVRPSASSTRRS